MTIHLSESNFRTRNIVRNMSVAAFVTTTGDNYHVGFNTEWYDERTKKYVPSKIIYVINRDLVSKHREKMDSNKK